MNEQKYIRYETPEAIYELYLTITQKPVVDFAKQKKKAFYKSLADRMICEQGSLEAAFDVLDYILLLLQLERRMGNIRHKYPGLEKHEIMELLYDQITNN